MGKKKYSFLGILVIWIASRISEDVLLVTCFCWVILSQVILMWVD